MARIAGVNIPDNKHTVISLTYIYGVGRTTSQKICADAGVNPAAKIKDLSDGDADKIVGFLNTLTGEQPNLRVPILPASGPQTSRPVRN